MPRILHNWDWITNTSIINQHNENLYSAACQIAGLYCRSSCWRNGEKITNGCYKYSLLVTLYFFPLHGPLENKQTVKLCSYFHPSGAKFQDRGLPLLPKFGYRSMENPLSLCLTACPGWLLCSPGCRGCVIAGYPPSHGQMQIFLSLFLFFGSQCGVLGFPGTSPSPVSTDRQAGKESETLELPTVPHSRWPKKATGS